MINKINADMSARFHEAVKPADDTPQNGQNTATINDSDKIEISNRAKVAAKKEISKDGVETFNVNFWSRGLIEDTGSTVDEILATEYAPVYPIEQETTHNEEAAKTGIDITVDADTLQTEE